MLQKLALLSFSDDRDLEIHLLCGALRATPGHWLEAPSMFCLSFASEDGQSKKKKGVSECCTTLSEPYGIDFVDV